MLKAGKNLPKSNQLTKLSPFVDEYGIVQIGGRLSRADIPFDAKSPLLPGKNPITRLIIKHFREKCMHGGPKLTESVMRQHFWVTSFELKKHKTCWFFSPAGAPHFNGLAEAAVKSCKLYLKRTIGEVKLPYEELCTLLAQVEACVNSRPLIVLSSDLFRTEQIQHLKI